ncbi:hypothetical protein JXA80_01275 [bacterium]|nr:hypothetical protein [candidate division CSSED10-310 bacterium]
MKNRYRNIGLILVVIQMIPAVSAGIRNESFFDYSGQEPLQTTADWNIFDGHLTIPSTPSYIPSDMIDAAPLTGGGFAVLFMRQVGETKTLVLQRYDGWGNSAWETPQTIATIDTGGFVASMAVSGNAIGVFWEDPGPNPGIFAQRVSPDGALVWEEPVRVNRDIPGNSFQAVDAAGVENGDVVVVWSDRRVDDTYSIYAQRLDATGSKRWNPADIRVHPSGTANERYPQVAMDGSGRSFVVWEENDDIVMNRLDASGTPAWSSAILVTMDSANVQSNAKMVVRDDHGVLVSYREVTGGNESVEIVARDFEGSPLWASETVVKAVADRMDNQGLIWADTAVICAMGSPYEGTWRAYTRAVAPDGSPLTADVTPITLPGVDWYTLTGVHIVDSIDVGPLILVRNGSDYFFDTTYLIGLDTSGIPDWNGYAVLDTFSGPVSPNLGRFIKGASGDAAFSIFWTDARNGVPGVFSRDLTWPLTRIGTADVLVSETIHSFTVATQALDGSRVYCRMNREETEDRMQVQARRFDSAGVPVWDDWRTVSDASANPDPREIDAVSDTLGRTAVAWVDERTGTPSLYYQLMSPDGTRLLPGDLRLNNGAPVEISNLSVAFFGDGTVAAAWRDDHADGFHAYYTRIAVDGTILYNPPIRVDAIPGVQVTAVAIAEYVGFIYVATITSDIDGHRIYASLIAGDSVAEEYLVAGPYIDAGEIRTVVMEPAGLVVAWSASDGVETSIWAQRISRGILEWGPARVNASGAVVMEIVDLVSPGPQQLTAMFRRQNVPGLIEYRLQSLNLTGTRQFSDDQPLVDPLPVVRNRADAVSVSLNAGEPVGWAAISHARGEPRGGGIFWFLSGDGGMTWIDTMPGAVVTFDPPAMDLRWGVSLQAEPAQLVSPLVDDLAVVWGNGSPYLTTELSLNQEIFEAGDPFNLELFLVGSGGVAADTFVILDVYGLYWFWPGWTHDVDYITSTPPAGITPVSLFDFNWPAVTGSASGLFFWAGALAPGTAELVGDIDWVAFGYQ